MTTLSPETLQRFHGIERLYGEGSLEILMNSHVVIVGIGGVGSWAAEALARSGVGRLTLIDLDDICVTNTNRQLHTHQESIGQMKVQVMASRLQKIHPDIQVRAIEEFLTEKNIEEALGSLEDVDILLDAIDGAESKAHLIHHALKNNREVVTVGAAGGRQDPTAIRSADLSEAQRDRLLLRVRKTLKRELGHPKGRHYFHVSSVFSLEGPKPFPKDEQNTSKRLDCASGPGTAAYVTGSFGFCASSLIIKKLLTKKRSGDS